MFSHKTAQLPHKERMAARMELSAIPLHSKTQRPYSACHFWPIMLEQQRWRSGFGSRLADAQEFQAFLDLALNVGRPKAAYTVSFVEYRNGDTITVEGVQFTSRTLTRKLESVERIFPLLATCGHEMDDACSSTGDMLKSNSNKGYLPCSETRNKRLGSG